MSNEIFTLHGDGKLVELKEEPYEKEENLQRLIELYPNLIPGEQIDPQAPRRWLLIRRELRIPLEEDGPSRMALDHLYLDQDGIPTFVEVKRSSDTRIRREVVGQMLDYAANAISFINVEVMQTTFEEKCATAGEDAGLALRTALGENIDPSDFWQRVKTNLLAGKIRLIFVADKIPEGLRRIVEFLNGQMDPAEVLAVQISQFVGESSKALVPTVFGQTSEAQQRKRKFDSQGEQWTGPRFFAVLAKTRGNADVEVARKLLTWGKNLPRFVYWGRGKVTGAFVPQIRYQDRNYQFFHVQTSGKVNIPFETYLSKPPFDGEEKRVELLGKLNSFLPEKLAPESINGYPGIWLSALADENAFREFLAVYEWFSSQIIAN